MERNKTMANIKWCGLKKCSECERSAMCRIDNCLACSPDCDGFVNGTEQRKMKYCFENCDHYKIREIIDMEGKDLSEIFDEYPNHVYCEWCGEIILPNEIFKRINLGSDDSEIYLCMDKNCENSLLQEKIEILTLAE